MRQNPFIGISNLEAIRLASVEGVVSVTILFGSLLVPLILSSFVFSRLVYFKECYTLGDVMKKLYGSKARFITAFIAMTFCLLMIIGQFVAAGVLSRLLDLSPKVVILLVGVFVTSYSALRGIRSFTSSHIIQSMLIIIGMGLLVEYVLSDEVVGGLKELYNKLKEHGKDGSSEFVHHLKVWEYPNLKLVLLSNFFLCIYPTLFFAPPIVQRVLITNDKREWGYTFASLAVFYVVFRLMSLVIGLSVMVLDIGKGEIDTHFL